MPDGFRITVGELRRDLSIYPDDADITFGCTENGTPLIYNRVKERGPRDVPEAERLVQVELNELHDGDLPFR